MELILHYCKLNNMVTFNNCEHTENDSRYLIHVVEDTQSFLENPDTKTLKIILIDLITRKLVILPAALGDF